MRKKRVAAARRARQTLPMTNTASSLSERSVAYGRMADALSHLGDTWRDWPDLAECARAVGLSPHHFQREFTQARRFSV